MVWYQNSSHDGVTTTGDNDITELFEHIMHTLHVHGVRGAVEGSVEALNYYKTNQEPYEANDNSWKTSELYLAVKEAVENDIFYPEYAPDLLDHPKAFEVAAKEYTYALNFSMWEMGKEFWTDKNVAGDGSLEPEWSDSALTPEGVLLVNPLGYSLFNKYFAPVLSKPDFITLRSMFQDNDGGLSGYVSDEAAALAQPIGSLADQSVEAGISLNLSEILSSFSSDGDSYSWINVYDATGGNNFVKNGVEIDASAGAWVSSSDLVNTTIKGDNQASEQTLWFQTYEGGTYSAWDSLVLTTSGSVAVVAQPIGSLADQTVAAGSSVNLNEILSTTAADGGSYSWINVYDTTGGNNFVKSGVEIDASAGAWISPNDLANTTIKGDSQASEQTLWFQTYDGSAYSDWDSLVFTTTGSGATVAQPIGSLTDQTVAAGGSLNLSEILSTSTADGGSYSWFKVYDATGGNNFVKNGVAIDASVGAWISSNDLANTTIEGDSQASEQTLWFQTYDGSAYSDWDSLVFTTTGSGAAVAQPIGSLTDQTVAAGGSLNLSEILSTSTADGGSYSWFKVYDATGGNNFVKNGVAIDASVGAWILSNDLANTTIEGDSQASEQTLWFQTYDGSAYSDWDSLVFTTTESDTGAQSGPLKIVGSLEAGSKLTASAVAISDDDGLGAFEFSWFRNGQEITNFKTWQNDPVNNIEIKHLVMGDGEIQMRKETAGPEAILKVIILQGGVEVTHTVEPTAANPTGRVTVDSAQPADWQSEIMQSVIAKIPEYIDLNIDLVNTIDEADITIFVHPLPNQDQLNGFNGQFQGSKLIMSYQTGLQNGKHLETDMALLNTYWNERPELRKDWEEIFIHELGHLLGLEHPWDMKDGDTDQAITSSDQPHTHTLMGYSNTGKEGWFTDIDLAALKSIWGNSNASKEQFEVYESDIGDEIYAQVTYTDGAGNFEVITSDTITVIA
jgi:hypothetical protein